MRLNFTHIIIEWYHGNKRDLPWRNTEDPYKIWLSEIILQQTRVAQGLPYYEKFVEKYPTIIDLARADEQDVLKLWQGLGYYSRARNLHFTAKLITDVLNGIFPDSYKKLLKMKGIGDYTAAAIASFAFGEKVPTLDGNVYRVLSRYFGLEIPIDTLIAKVEFKKLASKLIDPKRPDVFNQAVMEFGALQCVSVSPICKNCPLNESCYALKNNKISDLPFKSKKVIVSSRNFHYLLFLDKNQQTIVQKREKNDIWKHLFEFPLLESDDELNLEQIVHFSEKYADNILNISILNSIPIKHKLTHQEIDITFWKIEVDQFLSESISFEEIHQYPFPIVIHKFLKNFLKDN
jgi:A/G-specific adenine glycosylase